MARRKQESLDINDTGSSAGEVTDAQLLQRHLQGDSAAFGALIERYRQELYAFLARFVGDRHLAEDVFQEAFLQLHISAGSFDLTKRLKPWLFTIAANKARDALRKRSRRQMAPLDASVGGGDEDAASYGDLMPADIPAPQESLMNLELRQSVENIVRQMPDHLRIVLVLAYFSELPYKEIAEIVEAPLGTVKSRLHAAVKMFAEKWQGAAKRLGYEHES
ncbi:hypothetical protein LCGC14_0367590 [marine sediment metagenome]|uniref:Uncharacterized protein n=1 Tax=marine sediment metagenome TaxID=412755 RepID=A0A0F9WEH0_9ZZZZ|nr:sigma-70 family RNA polymerase sigma factor [Phycisphaerae bacterium]HDZ44458.1 sigma-70 family RNA polymerase sigma factor [Phycisphaerae bacterium]